MKYYILRIISYIDITICITLLHVTLAVFLVETSLDSCLVTLLLPMSPSLSAVLRFSPAFSAKIFFLIRYPGYDMISLLYRYEYQYLFVVLKTKFKIEFFKRFSRQMCKAKT